MLGVRWFYIIEQLMYICINFQSKMATSIFIKEKYSIQPSTSNLMNMLNIYVKIPPPVKELVGCESELIELVKNVNF